VFTLKERCKLTPLAKSGPFQREFIVEVAVSIFKPGDGARVVLLTIDDDGTEKKLAEGTYMPSAELLSQFRKKTEEKG
jgi:hypothetical protein